MLEIIAAGLKAIVLCSVFLLATVAVVACVIAGRCDDEDRR